MTNFIKFVQTTISSSCKKVNNCGYRDEMQSCTNCCEVKVIYNHYNHYGINKFVKNTDRMILMKSVPSIPLVT